MNSRYFNARALARELMNSRVHWGEKCTFSRWIRNFIFISISLLFGLNLHFRRQNIEILQKIVFVWLPVIPHKFINEISPWFFVSFLWFLAERITSMLRCLFWFRLFCFERFYRERKFSHTAQITSEQCDHASIDFNSLSKRIPNNSPLNFLLYGKVDIHLSNIAKI